MDYYDILLAKKLSGGGSGEPTNATGSFTPNQDITSVTINTGLSSINGMVIYPTANINTSGAKHYVHTVTVLPNNTYDKFFLAYTYSNGSTKTWLQYVSDTPPYTISGGDITINVSDHWYKGNIKYNWEAW